MAKEKIKQVVEKNKTKIIFIVEFITSIIFSVLLLKILITKNYNGYWSLKYLLEIIPVIIILFTCIIKNILINKNKIENLWIGILIPIGMLFLIFIIPTYVPDEQAHLWKAYEISTGKVITKVEEDGSYNTTIPEFYEKNVIPKISKYSEMLDRIHLNTDYNSTVEVTNPASGYFPLMYTFSSIGLFLGRIVGVNGIYAEYIARLFNYFIYLILGYYSMKKIPFGKMTVGVLLFMPMCLQQGTSMSIDCLINGLSIFFVSYTLYIKYKEEELTNKDKIIYICTGVLLAVAKYVYIPITCLSLLTVTNKKISKKEKILLILGTIVVAVIIASLWFKVSSSYVDTRDYITENNVNFREQVKFLIQNPKDFTRIILMDGLESGEKYLYEAVGNELGWLNIEVPHIKITIIIFIFILSIFLENHGYELKNTEKIYVILITLGIYFLVIIGLYFTWSPVGSQTVMGVQGRYLVPILMLPILCLAKKENYVKINNIQFILPIVLAIIDLTVIDVIFKFFV